MPKTKITLLTSLLFISHFIFYPLAQTFAQTSLPATKTISPNFSGQEIILNGNKVALPWRQWQEGTSIRTGISDLGAMQFLGLDLLNTDRVNLQPVRWFLGETEQSLLLKAKQVGAYRYLDITELAAKKNWNLQRQDNNLNINLPVGEIVNIAQIDRPSGQQIIVDLNKPTFWQITQNGKEAVIVLNSNAQPDLLAKFQPSQTILGEKEKTDEDDLGAANNSQEKTTQLTLENNLDRTKILLKFPPGNRVKVSSASNRLIIDILPDAFTSKNILWSSGIRWRQEFISLQESQDLFPVVWLEIDLRSTNLILRPIDSQIDGLTGTLPILTLARQKQALAAINGGFFNRNNQQPLGAIRRNNRWLSGPILNRGAIAWNDLGQVKIGRLSLEETATTSKGKTLPILFLNSAYIQTGLARYTKEWGLNYIPLTDNETIFLVEKGEITQMFSGGIAKENSFPIPANGYLLTSRGNNNLTEDLSIGTKVNLNSITIPQTFSNYPHILGAGPLLLENNQIILDTEAEKFSKAFDRQTASRSAIATTNTGKLIVAAIHNRAGGKGPTLQELAQIMQRLGAVNALNLDGGSSTSLYLGGQLIDRSPATAAKVHNGLGIFLRK